jgi:hypothetical protein
MTRGFKNALLNWSIVALVVAFAGQYLPVGAQTAIRLFGTLSTGVTKPVSVASDGSMNVSLSGGGASTSTITVQKDAIGTTSTDGFVATNTTAAAAGAQQISPRSCWTGQGWKTDATAASQEVKFCVQNTPVQGTANPTGNWDILAGINGGALSTVFRISSAGTLSQVANVLGTSGAMIGVSGRGGFQMSADGIMALEDTAQASFTRVCLGPCTASFPALRRSTTSIEAVLADNSAYTAFIADRVTANSKLFMGAGGTSYFYSGQPTVSSAFGTSPVITGTATSGSINVGTGGTATGGVLAMGATATNGWNCTVFNITALAANRANQWTVQTASSTTTVTVQNQTISTGAALAWTASDVVRFNCTAF